jgi:ABC-type Fe3+/spermidine/putrescine transport system ATPase subunit
LARAIVFDPPVILMDEPLGALDKKLRQHMQLEIKELQARLGATVIYVTHDQEEALTMSDRIAVLHGGRIVQLGSPRELYDHPADAFVADFLGEMNFLPAEWLEGEATACRARIGRAVIEARCPADATFRSGTPVRIAVRPERIAVTARDTATEDAALTGRVSQLIFNGASLAVLVRLDDGGIVRADVSARSSLAELDCGDPVAVAWDIDDARVYPGTEVA